MYDTKGNGARSVVSLRKDRSNLEFRGKRVIFDSGVGVGFFVLFIYVLGIVIPVVLLLELKHGWDRAGSG